MIRWITNKLYQRQIHNVKKGIPLSLEKELRALYPGEEVRWKWKRHCEEKVKTAILFSAIGLVVVIFWLFFQNSILLPDGSIKRTTYKEGKQTVSLDAKIENEVYPIEITVDEKELTKEETQEMLQQVSDKLPSVILNKNTDLKAVSSSLNLVMSLTGYPAKVEWESSDESIISRDGMLGDVSALQGPTEVLLHANISYGDYEKVLVIPICISPPEKSEYESIRQELTNRVQESQEERKKDPVFVLPKTWKGKPIVWVERTGQNIFGLIAIWIMLVWLLIKRKDEVLKEKWKKRNDALLLEYGEFVGKIRLLTGAGLSFSNALKRMDTDYSKRKKEHKEKKYVYEELQFAVKKMDSGVSLRAALQEFGIRCDPPCYKKLVSILLQNQKKGNRGLFTALDNEVKNAFEERKTIAKKLGEEAGTKLLVPMMLLMAMVMIMMIVPAFISFGAI